jgi:hypothetical protein
MQSRSCRRARERIIVKRFAGDVAALIGLALVLSACGATRTVFVNGNGAGAESTKQAASVAITASAPVPAPVATTALLSSKCVTGFVVINPDTGLVSAFSPFADPSGYPTGTQTEGGYQVTLTDTSAVTAEVTGFSVVFYSSGDETGSADAGTGDTFITPGQSLTWTETTDVMNAGSMGAVDVSATCALVKWDYPHPPPG